MCSATGLYTKLSLIRQVFTFKYKVYVMWEYCRFNESTDSQWESCILHVLPKQLPRINQTEFPVVRMRLKHVKIQLIATFEKGQL